MYASGSSLNSLILNPFVARFEQCDVLLLFHLCHFEPKMIFVYGMNRAKTEFQMSYNVSFWLKSDLRSRQSYTLKVQTTEWQQKLTPYIRGGIVQFPSMFL